jgi:hypothetical protein
MRFWIILLSCIVVFAAFAAPLAVITANQRAAHGVELTIACQSARSNIVQLEALRTFAMQIGVPWIYPIPEEPAACDGH